MTTTTARVSASLPHPSTQQAVARGVLLLIGGLVVILVVEPVGPKKLYWMPLIIGLTYLVSSIAGGRSGGLWVPGLMVTAWGVATTTVLSGAIRADFTATTILAIGIGAILATQLPRFGIPCNALAIAVIIFLRSGTRLCEIVEHIDHIGPAHEPLGDVHDAGDPQRAVSRHIETTRHRSNPSQ